MMTEMAKGLPGIGNLDYEILMKDELAQALHGRAIPDDSVPKIGWILLNSRWTLLVNRTKVPFWTSDNPVALFNPIDYGNDSGVGFAVRGIQTHFPLNSKLLLTILDPESYDTPAVKIVKDPERVSQENEFQLYNATRFVISAMNDFSMARKISEQDEALAKPREKVTVETIEQSGRSIIHMSKKAIKSSRGPSSR